MIKSVIFAAFCAVALLSKAEFANAQSVSCIGSRGGSVELAKHLTLEHLNHSSQKFHNGTCKSGRFENWLDEFDLWLLAAAERMAKIYDNDYREFATLTELKDAENHGFHPRYLEWDEKDGVYRIGLSWIWFRERMLKPKDGCGPPKNWEGQHCIEEHDEKRFVVKMKVGHKGFPVVSIAASHSGLKKLEKDEVEKAVAALAERKFSNKLSKHWLLTSVDNGRDVEFQLYKPDDSKPFATATGEDAKPGKAPTTRTDKETGETYNSCGGVGSACPTFFDLDEKEAYDELVDDWQAGEIIWPTGQ